MNISPQQAAEAIQRAVSAPDGRLGAGAKFSVFRNRSAGTPTMYEEKFALEIGGQARYSTIRNFVDAADAPIGQWQTPVEASVVQEIAAAMAKVKFWDLAGKGVSPVPGGEVNAWGCSTEKGDFALAVGEDGATLSQMSGVDLLFRHIANVLIAREEGASLRCALDISTSRGFAIAQIVLVNDGKEDCRVGNPLKGVAGADNFLRVEAGPLPKAAPGVTGEGIRYQPLPLPEIDKLPSAWNEATIVLKAGKKLASPFTQEINLSQCRGWFLRGVYSHYGTAATLGIVPGKDDLPLVRGRTFSAEVQLKV